MFDISKFPVDVYDSILSRGLSQGLGVQGERVCIEAAICETLGLPHSDDPKCVAKAVRSFKIFLNDASWSSPQARAQGLRNLGLAQLGSLGVVNDTEFTKRLAEKTIRILIPKLFRQVFVGNKVLLAAALRCEQEGSTMAAEAARSAEAAARAESAAAATWAAWAAMAAARAAAAAGAAESAARSAEAARAAAKSAWEQDSFLILSADLALETLRELGSPGIQLLSSEALT